MAAARYVALNPAPLRLAARAWRWRWSSARAHLAARWRPSRRSRSGPVGNAL